VAVLTNLASAADRTEAATLRGAGVPVLEGTATGLSALRHLLAYRDFLARKGAAPEGAAAEGPVPEGAVPEGAVDSAALHPSGSATLPHRGSRQRRGRVRRARDQGEAPDRSSARRRWRARLGEGGRPLDEAEGLALLGDWGMPVVAAEVATSLEAAVAAAAQVGWPVALKTAVGGIAHKSDVGGVVLGLDEPDRLAAAYEEVAGRLGPRVLVAAMAAPGVELALGVVHDTQFGPLVMVAAGGVLVEVLRDRRFALPPVDHHQALAMLDRLVVRPLLDGIRGGPPTDRDAVADAIVSLSDLAVDLGPPLAAVDVNPLIAGPTGCIAVDALVIPRGAR
jgi:acyl-CoA synthetase (NDP forming)